MNENRVIYTIDGIDFRDYGVYVSGSKGVVNRPKLKRMASTSWDDYHGESVGLQNKFYEHREIVLSCFIKAESKSDFIEQLTKFERLFDKLGTQRLVINANPEKPLIYEVYCKDEINVTKKWSNGVMVGTFDLKLIEPEPVKRVLKYSRTGESDRTCTIKLSTRKLVNIYWGDGSVNYDISGNDVKVVHDYEKNGDYYIVVTGCIDEITKLETTATVIWNRL